MAPQHQAPLPTPLPTLTLLPTASAAEMNCCMASGSVGGCPPARRRQRPQTQTRQQGTAQQAQQQEANTQLR